MRAAELSAVPVVAQQTINRDWLARGRRELVAAGRVDDATRMPEPDAVNWGKPEARDHAQGGGRRRRRPQAGGDAGARQPDGARPPRCSRCPSRCSSSGWGWSSTSWPRPRARLRHPTCSTSCSRRCTEATTRAALNRSDQPVTRLRQPVELRSLAGSLNSRPGSCRRPRDGRRPEADPSRPYPARRTVKGSALLKLLHTTDPKVIAMLYLVTSFVFFFIGGAMALLMRAELARPGQQFLSQRAVQPAVHHARHDHAAALRHADPVRFANLSCRCRSARRTSRSRG